MWTVLLGNVFTEWLHEQEKVLADLVNLQTYGPVFLAHMQIQLKDRDIRI